MYTQVNSSTALIRITNLLCLLLCFLVVEHCLCHRLKGDEIVLEWVAFSTTKGGLKLSPDNLEHFEHEVSRRHRVSLKSRHVFIELICSSMACL